MVEIGRYRDKLPTWLDKALNEKEMKGEDLRERKVAQLLGESNFSSLGDKVSTVVCIKGLHPPHVSKRYKVWCHVMSHPWILTHLHFFKL